MLFVPYLYDIAKLNETSGFGDTNCFINFCMAIKDECNDDGLQVVYVFNTVFCWSLTIILWSPIVDQSNELFVMYNLCTSYHIYQYYILFMICALFGCCIFNLFWKLSLHFGNRVFYKSRKSYSNSCKTLESLCWKLCMLWELEFIFQLVKK